LHSIYLAFLTSELGLLLMKSNVSAGFYGRAPSIGDRNDGNGKDSQDLGSESDVKRVGHSFIGFQVSWPQFFRVIINQGDALRLLLAFIDYKGLATKRR